MQKTMKNNMLAAFDKVLRLSSTPGYVDAVMGPNDTLKKLDNGVGTEVVSDVAVGIGYTDDIIYAEEVVVADVVPRT